MEGAASIENAAEKSNASLKSASEKPNEDKGDASNKNLRLNQDSIQDDALVAHTSSKPSQDKDGSKAGEDGLEENTQGVINARVTG